MDMISDNTQKHFFLVDLNFPFLPAELCEKVSDPTVINKGMQKLGKKRKCCGNIAVCSCLFCFSYVLCLVP